MLELVQRAANYHHIFAKASNQNTGQQMVYPEAYRHCENEGKKEIPEELCSFLKDAES